MERKEPILIGPTGAGKTTISKLYAEQTETKCIALDKVRFEYYRELNYNEEYVNKHRKNNLEEILPYWEPFNAHAVKRTLEDYADCIFDFGAIHSVYDDPIFFANVQKFLSPFPHVFLLLPVSDTEQNIELLFKRGETFYNKNNPQMWRRIIERFVKSPCNSQLAKYTIYTEGKNPETIVQEMQVQIEKFDP